MQFVNILQSPYSPTLLFTQYELFFFYRVFFNSDLLVLVLPSNGKSKTILDLMSRF